MTRDEVIRALEVCTAAERVCEGCPLLDETWCEDRLMDAALVLLKAEPKRGRWVKMTGMMPPEYHGHYECSECQWHLKGLRNSWNREEKMHYCPNCGSWNVEEEPNG